MTDNLMCLIRKADKEDTLEGEGGGGSNRQQRNKNWSWREGELEKEKVRSPSQISGTFKL
jgi:hypothetical protein